MIAKKVLWWVLFTGLVIAGGGIISSGFGNDAKNLPIENRIMINPAAGDAGIDGQVADLTTNQPVMGASVLLIHGQERQTTVSDGQGFYHFRGLTGGEYTLAVIAAGYADAPDQTVTVKEREIATATIIKLVPLNSILPDSKNMTPLPTTLMGTIQRMGSQGAGGTLVRLIDSDGKIIQTQTDLDGGFRFTGIDAGHYQIVASHPGWVSWYREIEILETEEVRLFATLTPENGLVRIGPQGGQVLAPNGALLIIPSGALDREVEIGLVPLNETYLPQYETDWRPPFTPVKLLPDNLVFLKPVTLRVPLNVDKKVAAGIQVNVNIFHGDTFVTENLIGMTTADGMLEFTLTDLKSIIMPPPMPICTKIPGSDWGPIHKTVYESSGWQCENGAIQSISISVSAEASIEIPGGLSVGVSGSYSKEYTCEAPECKRRIITIRFDWDVSGYNEKCYVPSIADIIWEPRYWTQAHTTSKNSLVGPSASDGPCCDGASCTSDNDLCTIDTCKQGECIHTPKECPPEKPDCKKPTGECVSSTGRASLRPPQASQSADLAAVNADGGFARFANHALTLEIPSGIITDPITLVYQAQPGTSVAGFKPLLFFTLDAYLPTECGWKKYAGFERPVNIRYSFAGQNLSPEEEKATQLYAFNNRLNQWFALPGVYDLRVHELWVKGADHLLAETTLYALAIPGDK